MTRTDARGCARAPTTGERTLKIERSDLMFGARADRPWAMAVERSDAVRMQSSADSTRPANRRPPSAGSYPRPQDVTKGTRV